MKRRSWQHSGLACYPCTSIKQQLQYWLALLRTQACSLSSLRYLKTEYLGLTKCHPIFTTCGSFSWEVENTTTTQARLLTSRYRVEALSGHWVPWNRTGICSLPTCWGTEANHKGTDVIFHIYLNLTNINIYDSQLFYS